MKFLALIAALSCFGMTATARETGPIHLVAARPTPPEARSSLKKEHDMGSMPGMKM